ncbi:flagellar basal-body rod protein FlgG [Paraferrimonas sp. SM1919]|uniref:flagellar basal-body rod protein FlgG n=1 Tax=Paraferrimonas sp. SM1919 TaxID=2662263 RepID=UPI0013CF9A3E|nr:flagellar basal-body rod protein FlgG [Paraferrimonas sp. SM1919]
MQAALWISKTGLAAQDTKMSAIANNLANVNTVGFKKSRVGFSDLFYQTQRQAGAQVDQQNQLPTGLQIGNGVRVTGTQKVFTSGTFETTNQDLDMAIIGQGFFEIEMANGERAFTRNGQFHLNSEGLMVNGDGLPLVPQVEVPEEATGISIGTDGLVTVSVAGDVEPQEIGQINLINFANAAGLEAIGGNLFRETAGSGPAVEGIPGEGAFGSIKHKHLEGSNVSVVDEMVEMISTQRAYEMNAKVVSSADSMLKFLNQSL